MRLPEEIGKQGVRSLKELTTRYLDGSKVVFEPTDAARLQETMDVELVMPREVFDDDDLPVESHPELEEVPAFDATAAPTM